MFQRDRLTWTAYLMLAWFGYLQASPGLVIVHDADHAWPRAFIAVFDDPYFAVTGPDGKFAIEGVPAEEDRDSFIAQAIRSAEAAVKGARGEEAKLSEAVRLAVRRCATEFTGKKPVVRVLIVRV